MASNDIDFDALVAFADNMVEESVEDVRTGRVNPGTLNSGLRADGPDYSNVVLSEADNDFFLQTLTTDSPGDVKYTPSKVVSRPRAKRPQPIREAVQPKREVTLTEVADRLDKLTDVVVTLAEMMTSVGMIGVNMAGPAPDPMKDEEKRKKRKVDVKAQLKNRIRKGK